MRAYTCEFCIRIRVLCCWTIASQAHLRPPLVCVCVYVVFSLGCTITLNSSLFLSFFFFTISLIPEVLCCCCCCSQQQPLCLLHSVNSAVSSKDRWKCDLGAAFGQPLSMSCHFFFSSFPLSTKNTAALLRVRVFKDIHVIPNASLIVSAPLIYDDSDDCIDVATCH